MSLFRRKPDPVYDHPPSRPTTSTRTIDVYPRAEAETCQHCRHAYVTREAVFDRVYDAGGGYTEHLRPVGPYDYHQRPYYHCRRQPPQASGKGGSIEQFWVQHDHWCGEFKARDVPTVDG